MCLLRTRKWTVLTSVKNDYCVSADVNLLKTIGIENRTWVYSYDIETKTQSSLWVRQGSPRLKKAWTIQHGDNVDCFLWLTIDSTWPRSSIFSILKGLREIICQKRSQLWINQSWMLHHGNAPAHFLCFMHNFLSVNKWLLCTSYSTISCSLLDRTPFQHISWDQEECRGVGHYAQKV